MSYANYDHAHWMQHQIYAAKRRAPGRRRKKPERGLEAAPERMTQFQRAVVHIIGIAGGGIYNAPISLNTIDWDSRGYGSGMSVVWRGHLATHDCNRLTMLVLLCHEARIRLEISPASNHHIRLSFHPNALFFGEQRLLPDIDEAVAKFRAYMPKDHPCFYQLPPTEADPLDRLADDGGPVR